eukprot:9388235-Pyramimonas_sp.AAC.1
MSAFVNPAFPNDINSRSLVAMNELQSFAIAPSCSLTDLPSLGFFGAAKIRQPHYGSGGVSNCFRRKWGEGNNMQE